MGRQSGLNLRSTPHWFTIDGKKLYTWCALDTLIFPPILDREAYIEAVSRPVGSQSG